MLKLSKQIKNKEKLIKMIFLEQFRNKKFKEFIYNMNKANKFKRKTNSQNENFISHCSNSLQQNENCFKPNDWHSLKDENCFNKRYYMTGNIFTPESRRLSTESFQIEPFSQIGNVLHHNIRNLNEKSFIKTKKAKLYPKSKISFRQNRSVDEKALKNQNQTTNFQILKKQIQQLESLQILRGAQMQKPELNPQISIDKQRDNYQILSQNKVYIVRGQFNSGKNISLFQKQRQTIKKVLKNKKFRNYINPYRKVDTEKSSQNFNRLMHTQLKSNLIQNTDLSLFSSNECFRKRETPQVVKRFYRPQTCSGKLTTPNRIERSIKLQLANYVSSNSLSKRQKPVRSRTETSEQNYFINKNRQSTPSKKDRIQKKSIKRHQKSTQKSQRNKELLIICI